jgi:hypothetical protein
LKVCLFWFEANWSINLFLLLFYLLNWKSNWLWIGCKKLKKAYKKLKHILVLSHSKFSRHAHTLKR